MNKIYIFGIAIATLLLSACSTMQYTSNSSFSSEVKVLYQYPNRPYKSLGVIDFSKYKPGFRTPTVSDALPDLKEKVKNVGGNALIIRDQSAERRTIKISAEALKIKWKR